jgi:hypothetical protein
METLGMAIQLPQTRISFWLLALADLVVVRRAQSSAKMSIPYAFSI